ncbi:MAG: biopolymer transporter ExbD [Isosphaeraceae bacterium]|nr:biopolymer transporter ExbD [Isosphaeraceae bacterium]
MNSESRETRSKRYRAPDLEVEFPVTPLLDMSFQLLAFFILTFQAPSTETHLDLYLPASAAALPGATRGQAREAVPRRADPDLENDLIIRATADDLGELGSLSLGEAPIDGMEMLAEKLGRYAALMKDRPLRVRLLADDRLRYELAARIVGVCSTSGVASIRLSGPAPLAGGGR